jgi:hypothetical protein
VSEQTKLLDRESLAQEYGLGERGVDRIFTAIPIVRIPGYRRVFVWRSDVDHYLKQHTVLNTRERLMYEGDQQ